MLVVAASGPSVLTAGVSALVPPFERPSAAGAPTATLLEPLMQMQAMPLREGSVEDGVGGLNEQQLDESNRGSSTADATA